MNMREVARRAGVSSATVSRVINGSPLVHEDTARHVRKIIDELKFIPNPVATTLKYGRSRTYGLIIPDITNPFYPEFFRNFEELLVEADHEVLLAIVGSSDEAMVHSVRRMLMRQVDGVVLMASEFETKTIEPLLARRVPLVTVDRRRVQQGVSDVSIDFEGGMKAAVQHLAALGHKRIGFVEGTRGMRTSKTRLKAFQEGLEANGLQFYPQLAHEGNYRLEGGEAAARAILRDKPLPTAIMTVNDLTAFGVVRALHHAGVRVPEQISIVGLDNILLCDVLQPELTTIQIDLRGMAKACLEALEHTKAHPEERGKRFAVRTSLKVRESTTRPQG